MFIFEEYGAFNMWYKGLIQILGWVWYLHFACWVKISADDILKYFFLVFLETNKNIISFLSAEFALSMVSVNPQQDTCITIIKLQSKCLSLLFVFFHSLDL